ncbi:hypothetical protein WR25_19335 [Diploscapter pachys]|uniref:Uncharacterized protein n=1 Tax=Diploscapter pachys TaxID=2018661 RepID=A0A2A2J8A6_9BILA|nr:hypothetical protein WR25_19335 [Diploscapter pachys]
MMSFVIFVLLFKWSNSCLTTPDMDLPPVQPTTEPGIKLRKLNNNGYRYDSVHSFDNDDLHDTWLYFINTDYNNHIQSIDVHNNHNNDDDNNNDDNNNYYYNRLFRKFSSTS